jgi:hypothetical protein
MGMGELVVAGGWRVLENCEVVGRTARKLMLVPMSGLSQMS